MKIALSLGLVLALDRGGERGLLLDVTAVLPAQAGAERDQADHGDRRDVSPEH